VHLRALQQQQVKISSLARSALCFVEMEWNMKEEARAHNKYNSMILSAPFLAVQRDGFHPISALFKLVGF
jgi:hypothetical protein